MIEYTAISRLIFEINHRGNNLHEANFVLLSARTVIDGERWSAERACKITNEIPER